jgi:hypothetical protein
MPRHWLSDRGHVVPAIMAGDIRYFASDAMSITKRYRTSLLITRS